jgi:hypothetical protein
MSTLQTWSSQAWKSTLLESVSKYWRTRDQREGGGEGEGAAQVPRFVFMLSFFSIFHVLAVVLLVILTLSLFVQTIASLWISSVTISNCELVSTRT